MSEQPDRPEVQDTSEEVEPDEVTGASPGTAQACTDFGLSSLSSNLEKFGLKPPGQAEEQRLCLSPILP